jgi:hypothetical protein
VLPLEPVPVPVPVELVPAGVAATQPSASRTNEPSGAIARSDLNLFLVDDAPATLGAGDSATVDLSYSPLELETRSLASVQFAGSDGEKTSLNLFGEPVSTALILAPNPVDFGFVPLTTTAVECTTVSNPANGSVTLTGISGFASEDGAFAVATIDDATPPNPQTFPTTPIILAGGASAKVCFSFTPAANQEYTGHLTLVSDDPSGANPSVDLTGWGKS